MPDTRRAQSRLRGASETLLRDLELLRSLEEEKRTLPPGSARFQEIALEIQQLAAKVLESSSVQREVGVQIGEAMDASARSTPIDELTRLPQEILSDWRDAERRAGAAAPRSPEAAAAHRDAARLRDEYRQAMTRR